MGKVIKAAIAAALLASASLPAAPDPAVSERKELAVFALGYHGWDINDEALGSIDARIMEVFSSMRRFEIIGFAQRVDSGDLASFVSDIKKIKEDNLVIPEKYLLGEAFLTEAEMNRFIGAFYAVIPAVTGYSLAYVIDPEDPLKSKWNCKISASVTFLDVAEGKVMAAPVIEGTGSDPLDKDAALREAIDSLASPLEREARTVFPLDSKIVSVGGRKVKLRLGSSMGVKTGYEFAVMEYEEIDGVLDEREAGLVVVKRAGTEISDGTVLFSASPIGEETRLREIPRSGVDVSPYFRYVFGSAPVLVPPGYPVGKSYGEAGVKLTFSEGFYALKPLIGLQVPFSSVVLGDEDPFHSFPFFVYLGGELNFYIGRFQISPFVAGGASLYVATRRVLVKTSGNDEDEDISGAGHAGGIAGIGISFLITRDFKAYLEGSYQYWFGLDDDLVTDAKGIGAALGVTVKL